MTGTDFSSLTEYQSELVLDSFTTYARECRETPGCERLADDVDALRAAWLATHQARFAEARDAGDAMVYGDGPDDVDAEAAMEAEAHRGS